ncbi:MAG: DUF4177 domain-containing protein [Clostridiales bacterium]|nr:DUF4177 domain-containing protein [Clostridiales bacterium]
MKQYYVLSMEDQFFAGKFDSQKFQTALNEFAHLGWSLVTCATAAESGSSRQDFIAVLERDI